MELRQIEYFCTVSELENFTRTAEVLHVSQPSVTKAIKALESELQLTLIDRSQKHIALTEEGRVFLVHAQNIMQAVEETKQSMQRFQENVDGKIRFGVPPLVAAYLFPNFFMRFREAYPSITLAVQEFSDSQEVLAHVGDDSLDFGIVMGSDAERSKYSMSIMKNQLLLCLPKGHSLSGRANVSFEELRDEKFILQQPSTYQYRTVFDGCAQCGYMPDIVLCTSQMKTIKELVSKAAGISVLPDFVARSEPDLCRKSFMPVLQVEIRLVWGSHKTHSPVEKRFLHFMKEYIRTPEFKRQFLSQRDKEGACHCS